MLVSRCQVRELIEAGADRGMGGWAGGAGGGVGFRGLCHAARYSTGWSLQTCYA